MNRPGSNFHMSRRYASNLETATMSSARQLRRENQRYRGSGAVSAENAALSFRPAFLDRETGQVHASRFADGRPAPLHILDGLPGALVTMRSASGHVLRAKASLVPGFVRLGRFYTREEVRAVLA